MRVRESMTIRIARAAGVLLVVAAVSAGAVATRRQDDAGPCKSHLKQMSLGLLMYTQDYDEMFPPMKFPAQVHNRIFPYVKSRTLFRCPNTAADYLPNPALNYVTSAAIEFPAKMMMLRDAKPHKGEAEESFWNLSFADGHLDRSETEPPLGKPAPSPPPPRPLTRAEKLAYVRQSIDALRQLIRENEARTRKLEAEQRRLGKKR